MSSPCARSWEPRPHRRPRRHMASLRSPPSAPPWPWPNAARRCGGRHRRTVGEDINRVPFRWRYNLFLRQNGVVSYQDCDIESVVDGQAILVTYDGHRVPVKCDTVVLGERHSNPAQAAVREQPAGSTLGDAARPRGLSGAVHNGLQDPPAYVTHERRRHTSGTGARTVGGRGDPSPSTPRPRSRSCGRVPGCAERDSPRSRVARGRHRVGRRGCRRERHRHEGWRSAARTRPGRTSRVNLTKGNLVEEIGKLYAPLAQPGRGLEKSENPERGLHRLVALSVANRGQDFGAPMSEDVAGCDLMLQTTLAEVGLFANKKLKSRPSKAIPRGSGRVLPLLWLEALAGGGEDQWLLESYEDKCTMCGRARPIPCVTDVPDAAVRVQDGRVVVTDSLRGLRDIYGVASARPTGRSGCPSHGGDFLRTGGALPGIPSRLRDRASSPSPRLPWG